MYEEYANKIKRWFAEEGIPSVDVQDDNTNVAFDIQTGGTVMRIGFYKTSLDSIIILSGIKFTPEEQLMLSHLKTKRDVIWDLERILIQMHLEPIFYPNKENIEQIKVQKTIYFDSLTKSKIFEVATDVFQSIRAIRETFLKIGKP